MASLVRRAATRAILAGGAAVIAIWVAQDCESGHHEVTIVVDPRPMGEGVRAIRVDLFDRDGARGSIERIYRPGETRSPVRLRAGAPAPGAEVNIEVDTDDGLRRAHPRIDVEPGATVRIRLGEGSIADPIP
jgi:hypothetical protein